MKPVTLEDVITERDALRNMIVEIYPFCSRELVGLVNDYGDGDAALIQDEDVKRTVGVLQRFRADAIQHIDLIRNLKENQP